ncbi:MAG: Cdc6/Cdc18 family protein [Promethearchaeota archaeon]
MDLEDEFKKNLQYDGIFKKNGEKTLRRSFIPDKVLHRDELIKSILFEFKVFLKEDKAVFIGIKGGGGFGKTLISQHVAERLVNITRELGINFEYKTYSAFNFRTLGAILRDYIKKLFISGKGYSNNELMMYLNSNLKKNNKKLLIIVDEIQNFDSSDLIQLLSINECKENQKARDDYVSIIYIAREDDWNNILGKEKKIASRLSSLYTLPKYTREQLFDIFLYRRDLAFKPAIFSDENIGLIVDLAEALGDVYYGLELMRQAGKRAEFLQETEVLPEMIRSAVKSVSSEFREPVLKDLKTHELLTLLSIARVLERLDKKNVNFTTTKDAYEEYKLACEEFFDGKQEHHAITVFRKYITKLKQNKLISMKTSHVRPRGRQAELNIIDFSAELVREKVNEILKERKTEEN